MGLDLLVLAVIAAGLVGGWRAGFVARILSWIGLAIGLVVAVRSLPWALDALDESNELGRFAVSAALLIGLGMGGQAIGLALGARLRPRTTDGSPSQADRWSGLVAGGLGALVVLWLLLPVVANGPDPLPTVVARSRTVELFETWLPPPPDALAAVQTLAGPDFPEVFAALDPDLDVGPPPAASGLDPAVEASAARSVVKVAGPACYRIQTGTGFVVAPDLVLTNAHVVAGIADPTVERDDGTALDATVVLFDPDLDAALLAVPGMDRPALPIVDAGVGAGGGVFGHPLGRPLRIAPFGIEQSVQALGSDIYDEDAVTRRVLVLAAELAQGDSGAPLVSAAGEVVGMAFAISPDRDGVAFALPATSLVDVLAVSRGGEVSTGRCT